MLYNSGSMWPSVVKTSTVDITSSPCSIWLVIWSFGVDYSHMETGPLVWWKSFFVTPYRRLVLRGLPARGRSVTFPVWRKRCISRTMMEWLTLKWSAILLWLQSPLCMPTACHLSGMLNVRRTIELISNRFAVFVTCTHILTYLWNRSLIDFYLCVYDRVCKVPRVLFNICVCERKLIFFV
jgi:hypothetical protein